MKIRESIIVMNSKTYEMFAENAMKTASLQADPIGYIGEFTGIKVYIDENTPDMITEVWYRDVWEFQQELRKIKGENKDVE